MAIFSNIFKKDNKTWLNALIIVCSSLIVSLSCLGYAFSLSATSCNDDVLFMSINLTQSYIENQVNLFDKTMSVCERVTYQIENNSDETASQTSHVGAASAMYFHGDKALTYNEAALLVKKKHCNSSENITKIISIGSIVFSILLLWFSITYLSKY